MNIGKILNDGIKNLKNSDSGLRQILILSALGVIILGFGNKGNILPVYEGPEPSMGFGGPDMFRPPEGYGPQGNVEGGPAEEAYGPDGWGDSNYNAPPSYNNQNYKPSHSDRKRKHRHHQRDDRVFPNIAQVQEGSEPPPGNPNSPEVPYIVE